MANADRLLNRRGRKHYRRSYSMTEVRIGAVVLVGLAGVAYWVAHKGANPEEDLFANTPDLLDPGSVPVERGPLPDGLAAGGWKEGKLAAFDADNLYEKINGRAGYFKSKGFVSLLYLPLTREGTADDAIDLEVYDMGAPENALGAYVGEKPEGIDSTEGAGGVWHKDRNAMFMARGPLYIRAIGSRESEGVSAALDHLRQALETGLAAGARPWAHHLFVDALGFESGTVRYAKENAMSFEFGKNVYSVLEGEDRELFVTAAANADAAKALAKRYTEGFLSYGEKVEVDGAVWVKDQYLGAFSCARAVGPLVVGVKGAADRDAADKRLVELEAAAGKLPDEVLAKATSNSAPAEEAPKEEEPAEEAPAEDNPEDSYGAREGAGEPDE